MERMRQFTKEHLWIYKVGEHIFRIGISDYAQESLGVILFLNLPEKGDALNEGEAFGDIESVKTVSDLLSPVTGIVTQVNEGLLDEPSRVNSEPYECWLIEAEAEAVADGLMDEEAYHKYRESL